MLKKRYLLFKHKSEVRKDYDKRLTSSLRCLIKKLIFMFRFRNFLSESLSNSVSISYLYALISTFCQQRLIKFLLVAVHSSIKRSAYKINFYISLVLLRKKKKVHKVHNGLKQ